MSGAIAALLAGKKRRHGRSGPRGDDDPVVEWAMVPPTPELHSCACEGHAYGCTLRVEELSRVPGEWFVYLNGNAVTHAPSMADGQAAAIRRAKYL
jgi:hypothetical protein